MAFRIERKGETITLNLSGPDGDQFVEDMDWIRAGGLAASLEGHAEHARRIQYGREHRCVDCGAELEPGNAAETCGADCPTEATR